MTEAGSGSFSVERWSLLFQVSSRDQFRPGDVPGELAAVLARDGDLVLVAEDADGLAAAVLGTFDGRRGWVNRLATRPGHRGQGLATAILAELERRLAAKGRRKINLLIEPDNQTVSGFYRLRGYAEDELIFMEKWLLQLCAIERFHPPVRGSGERGLPWSAAPRGRRTGRAGRG